MSDVLYAAAEIAVSWSRRTACEIRGTAVIIIIRAKYVTMPRSTSFRIAK